MQLNKIAFSLATAALLSVSACAFAAGSSEYYPFSEMMSMKMMDKNKDAMVSKAEYMEMMSHAWDMNAKKMGAKGDEMTPEQFKQLMEYLKAGG